MLTDDPTAELTPRNRRLRLRYVVPGVVAVPVLAAIVFVAIVANTEASIRLSPESLATVQTPFGTGHVSRVSAIGGREQQDLPVSLRGDQVWPTQKVTPGARITVVATVDRPGWISWLTGKTERVTVTETAPVSKVASTYVVHRSGHAVTVKFTKPVQTVGSGTPGTDFDPHTVAKAESSISVPVSSAAGTVAVAAAVKPWEKAESTNITYFPRAKETAQATVVSSPALGSTITSTTPIMLTFSKPVSKVLGNKLPPVNPITPGTWHTINAHTIIFEPTGYGYGVGATVDVLLPSTVELVGAKHAGTPSDPDTGGNSAYPVVASYSVPQPSTRALQELLAYLGYLPVKFTPATPKVTTKPKPKPKPKPTRTVTSTSTTPATTTTGAATTTTPTSTGTTDTTPATTSTTTTDTTGVSSQESTSTVQPPAATDSRAVPVVQSTLAAEEAAIISTPKGTFTWRYKNTPSQLKLLWNSDSFTELTKGAVMAFEENSGLPVDGVAGPVVWKALITAAVKDRRTNFGYTFVMVSEKIPENIRVWHNGKIVVSGLANTGIPAAPTATGTYAVYEHLRVTTMSGLNPDGTPYDDPGIPWVSYFNGGDALHGFIRASYGFPQSLGCVEMPFAEAGQVWPYTPIGTIVHLTPA